MRVCIYNLDPVHGTLWMVRIRQFKFKIIARVYAAVAALWWDKVEVRDD